MRVERISPANEKAALDYLARAPYDNVFITYLVLFDLSSLTRGKIFVVTDGTRVRGVAYFGRQLALACDPEAVDALAEHAKRHRGERMIIGPRPTVAAFWDRIRAWHAAPRVVRERQLVMAIDRGRLKPYERRVTVRHARIDEWTAVADSSAEMIEQELDYDPRRASADFAPNVRHMIGRDLWWVAESLGRLCFFCNIGPWCRQTAQLQGIWTPPELRGKGLATASLAGVCDRLLDESPTLSLYVNDFNESAIRLYRRVGFEEAGEYQTLLF
jgi:RimJ/RimL family protein N-acetyltransferase